ncbi:hypothetical protein JL49_21130 [Pseudoalteromonas luteoviolacea]|nr:hypothetical protein JL49_21130 [Pseudoalteromonas luteoviolacea]
MLPIAGGGVSTQAFQFYTMLGKGNGWKLALYQNKRLAVHILSTFNAYEERSLYEFQAKDIPSMHYLHHRFTIYSNSND